MIFKLNENLDQNLLDTFWKKVNSKKVVDPEGFLTDYTWYTNDGSPEFHLFILGEKDKCSPERDLADYECTSYEEAKEWFDNFPGEKESLHEVYEDEEGYTHSETLEEALEDLSKEIDKLSDNLYRMETSSKKLSIDKIDQLTGKLEEANSLAAEIRWGEPVDESLNEDTVKQGKYWVNKGKEGTHGKFKTKKAADAQRKAMFAQGFKEALDDKVEFSEFEIKYPEKNSNFNKEKYGKYFDKEGKLIPEKEEEYFTEMSDDDFDWDEKKIDEALNNFTPDTSTVQRFIQNNSTIISENMGAVNENSQQNTKNQISLMADTSISHDDDVDLNF